LLWAMTGKVKTALSSRRTWILSILIGDAHHADRTD
jgi:hypothetical protein